MKAPRPLQSPKRPDTGDIGAQLIVDLDVSVRVGGDAGLVEAEIVGVRPPADSEQQMESDDLPPFLRSRPSTAMSLPCLSTRSTLRIDADIDAFLPEEVGDGLRDILVLAR